MVNYNPDRPKELGDWYEAEITKKVPRDYVKISTRELTFLSRLKIKIIENSTVV